MKKISWCLCLVFLVACTSNRRTCTPGTVVACYPSETSTLNIGECRSGTAVCQANGILGTCQNAVVPSAEVCDGRDNNCDGQTDEGITNECGGCLSLERKPGDACGACGITVCQGAEAVACQTLPGVDEACVGENGCPGVGVCPESKMGEAVCQAQNRNTCGVCGLPDVSLGAVCQTDKGCAGTLTCAADGTALCDGPLPNNCGVCGAPEEGDSDQDGVGNACDNCPGVANGDQADVDKDGVGDVCDNCLYASNFSQADDDSDGKGNACEIVISELAVFGPHGSGDEFVELYNPTSTEVDLTGWQLQYRAATGNLYWPRVTLPTGSSIPAKGYFLNASGGAAGFLSSPTADHTRVSNWPSPLQLANDSGHVRIGAPGMVDALNDARAIDTVAWGSDAIGYEGTGPAPAQATPEGSIERKANAQSTSLTLFDGGADSQSGNGYDSNDNANDFVLRPTREPQNRQAAPEP